MSGAKPPPYVMCYLCGRKYGTKSISIHEPSCIKKWHAENKKLPKHLRRKMPTRPDYSVMASGDVSAVDQVNEMAYQAAQEQLIPCEYCGRTFYPERLAVHHRSCTADKPASNRPRTVTKPRTTPSVQVSAESVSSFPSENNTKEKSQRRIQPKRQAALKTPDNQKNNDEDQGIPCGLCQKLFSIEEIGSHLITCNEEKTRHLRKGSVTHGTVSGSRKVARPSTRTLHRGPPDISDTVNSATYDLDSPEDEPRVAVETKPKKQATNRQINEENESQIVNHAECDICGRRFASDRLQKHRNVCQKTSSKSRKVFDSSKQRLEGIENAVPSNKHAGKSREPQKPKSNWRQTHEDFVRAIRAAKQVTVHMAKGGKASDLPPPPPSLNPNYIHCQHCDRRFNPTVAERHIPRCATIQNRPKPPKQKALDNYKPPTRSQTVKTPSKGSVRQMKTNNQTNNRSVNSGYNNRGVNSGYSHSNSSQSPRYDEYRSPQESINSNKRQFTKGRNSSALRGKTPNEPYKSKTFSGIQNLSNKSPSSGYSYNAMNYTSPNFFG